MYKDNIYKSKINNRNILKKNISDNNDDKKNLLLLSSVEVIDELLNNFFKKPVDKKIGFLFYHNLYSKNSCEKVVEIVLSKLNFIKINASKLTLYKSPLFFFIKKIIKNLPLVSYDDKKILWDRIFLFLKSFNIELNDNENIPTEVVFSEINYDDPIEYIKKEISDILRVYNINQLINIYIDNFDLLDFNLINNFYKFIDILFSDVIQFRFIAQIYKIEMAQNLRTKFPGNNDYTQLINFILKNSYNYFICDEINNTY